MKYSKLLANILATYGSFLVNLVVIMGTAIVVARTLGPEGKGQLALLILVPTTLMALGDLGIRQSTVYILAGGKHSLDHVVSAVVVAAVALGVLLLGVASLLFRVLDDSFLQGVERGPFYLIVSFLPAMLIVRYVLSVLRGLDRPQVANILLIFQGLVYFSLLAVLFFLLGAAIEWAVIAYVAGHFLAAILGLWILWAKQGWRPRPSLDRATFRALVFNGAQVSVILILGFLNRKISIYLVNGQLGTVDVGLFVVAVSIAEMVWIFPDAVGTILFPLVSSQSDKESNQTTPQMTRLTLIVTTVMALAVWIISRPLIPVVFGASFAAAVEPLGILLPGVVLLSVHKVIWRDMMGRGRPLLSGFSRGLTLVILVSLFYLLAPRMGLAGVAIATTSSYAAGTLVMIVVFTRYTGVSWTSLVIPQVGDFKLLAHSLQGFIGVARVRINRLMTQAS